MHERPAAAPPPSPAGTDASRRRHLRPNAHTTVATYCLLIFAGSVSFILPDSIDVPTPDVRPAIPAPRPAVTGPNPDVDLDNEPVDSLARRTP